MKEVDTEKIHEELIKRCPVLNKFERASVVALITQEKRKTAEEIRNALKELKPVADIEVRNGAWMIEKEDAITICDQLITNSKENL